MTRRDVAGREGVTHYAGALRVPRAAGATLTILPGWAACCSGARARRIRESGRTTYDVGGVTCAPCRRLIKDASALSNVGCDWCNGSKSDHETGCPSVAARRVEWPADLADVRAEIEASLARIGATVVRAERRKVGRLGAVSYFIEWLTPSGEAEDWYERTPEDLAFQIAAQCRASLTTADAARRPR